MFILLFVIVPTMIKILALDCFIQKLLAKDIWFQIYLVHLMVVSSHAFEQNYNNATKCLRMYIPT